MSTQGFDYVAHQLTEVVCELLNKHATDDDRAKLVERFNRELEDAALAGEQAFRRKHACAPALEVAARIREYAWAQRGKVGMGVIEQTIAHDLQAFAAGEGTISTPPKRSPVSI